MPPETCTHAGCENEATRTIAFPMRYLNKDFVGCYCDEHADEMLNPDPFYGMPGARELVAAASPEQGVCFHYTCPDDECRQGLRSRAEAEALPSPRTHVPKEDGNG